MYEHLENNFNSYKKPNSNGTIESLGMQWAKKYLHNLDDDFPDDEPIDTQNLNELLSQVRREKTTQKLRGAMRNVSLQAWNKTENLLFKEVKRHRIKPSTIDPWEITGDSFKIYEKALDVYIEQPPSQQLSRESRSFSKAPSSYTAPNQLVKAISASLGALRQKYTQKDPRVIGFVSMHHYTSQMLLQLLSPLEQSLLSAYFKAIDDHLYMSLQRAYTAAANLDCDSVALMAVRHLLPNGAHIATRITQKVIQLYPGYRSYSGCLNNKKVIISSIRDVEMFQVYLWVCANTGNIAAIQQELFPLCVMLYPTLKIHWEIIRQMLHLLGQEISDRLNTEQANTLMPYFQVLWHMFSPEVFGESNFDGDLNAYQGRKTCKPLFA